MVARTDSVSATSTPTTVASAPSSSSRWASARSFFSGILGASSSSTGVVSLTLEAAFRKNFLRRVKTEERTAIIHKLSALPKLSKEALNAFEKGLWSHTIFYDKSWPYFALQAFIDGHLTEMQISKLYLYQRCVEMNGKKVGLHALVSSDGRICGRDLSFLVTGLGESFSREDQVALERDLVTLSPEQTQFFSVQSRLLSSRELMALQGKKGTVMDMANVAVHMMKISLLIIPETGKQIATTLLIPPCLWYRILRIKFGANAVEPVPVLGFSTREKFSDIRRRIVGIPCSFVETPKIIHHEIDVSRDAGLFLHDSGYHLYTESANPHRKIWVDLALFMRYRGHQEKAIALLDRDCPLYAYPHLDENELGRRLETVQERFWYSFPYLVRRKVEFTEEEREDILRYFLSHEAEWETQYGLSSVQLEECCKHEREGDISLGPWLTSYNQVAIHIENVRFQLRPFFTLEKVKGLILNYV